MIFTKYAILAAALCGLPLTAASAGSVVYQEEQVSLSQPNSEKIDAAGYPHVTPIVKNHGTSDIRSVTVECGFMDKNRQAIGTGDGMVSNLRAGQRAFVDVVLIQRARPAYAECRVNQAFSIRGE
jgi:hypothetical protein